MAARLPRVPSLQHLSRMLDRSSAKVEKHLLQLSESSPRISYVPSAPLCKDHLRLDVSRENIIRGVELIKGDRQREVNRKACTAFLDVASEIPKGKFIEVDLKHYALGRNLHVAVNPFLYQIGTSENHLVWTSYWADLVLKQDQMAFFGTVLDITFFSSPDFRGDKLCFVDLGKHGGKDREPILMGSRDFPTMTSAELKEYSDSFVEGYLSARAKILKKRAEEAGDAIGKVHNPTEPMNLETPY